MFRIPLILSSVLALAILGSSPALAAEDDENAKRAKKDKEAARLEDARETFQDLRSIPDKEIPGPLLKNCRCVAVFPGVVKGALGWGGRHGKGVMSCRNSEGQWGPPIFLTLTGGSFGLQIGVEKAEVVLFFMNDRGARSLVESKFTLGGKGSVAAGPVGRSAEAGTDIKLNAEIYSYAKNKGLFAGISLEGAKLGPDKDALRRFYGQQAEPKAILFEHKAPSRPAGVQRFVEVLP